MRINVPLTLVCGVVLFLFMFLVVSDVTGRYLFSKPVPGTLEIGEIVLAFVIFLTLASTQMRGEHIRVMVLLDRLSPERRAWFELLTLAIGFSLMFVIAWHCLPYAIDSYASNERGLGSGSIPVYPGKFSFFVGCTLFGIQFFIQFLSRLFAKLAGEIPASKEKS